jgi:hypothetical protein
MSMMILSFGPLNDIISSSGNKGFFPERFAAVPLIWGSHGRHPPL